MRAFILAGGFATRLWPLTEKRAKPLLPLAGSPILTHLLGKIPGDLHVTVSTNAAFAGDMEVWARAQERPITVVIERTRTEEEKLGTTAALAQWITRENIDDDILLLTGDNYFAQPLAGALAKRAPGTAFIVSHDMGNREHARGFGTVIVGTDGHTVIGFEEKPQEPKTSLISTGCMIFPQKHLPTIIAFARAHPDHIGTVFEEFLRRGVPVHTTTFASHWYDIGSFASYLAATRDIVGEHIHREDGSVLEHTQCDGSIVLGKNTVVRNTVLRNTVLFDGCAVDDCVIENCVIDDRCALRGIDLTGKMLRAGTRLIRP